MKLKLNMHIIDRIVRLIIAIVIAVLYFTKVISGTLAIVLGVIAVIFIITSFIGWCAVYQLLGISTKGEDKDKTGKAEK